ncbi:hypothetical protein JCM19236_6466 [Vibrio sp. JCM 19236]|nr:hypothetical protein JCM19236_6466 [Vibrio sp. JCM 19236]
MQLLKEVDNNLVLKHQDYRIVMQQIMVSDGAKLGPFTQPNTMMTWEQAKEMYPNALVYLVDFNESLIDENTGINSSLYPDTLALESDRATSDSNKRFTATTMASSKWLFIHILPSPIMAPSSVLVMNYYR